jgi:hypothetical protein
VEGLPDADSPLDPEPGLGDNLSLGLFPVKASGIFEEKFPFVTTITGDRECGR